MQRVIVTGGFDDLRFEGFRFLEAASKIGPLVVMLWSDEAIEKASGKPPKFPQAEREYFVRSIRYVQDVISLSGTSHGIGEGGSLPTLLDGTRPDAWVVHERDDHPLQRKWAQREGLVYHVIRKAQFDEPLPPPPVCPVNPQSPRKKVVVTGCFDWFHSGHVRFTEEVSELGDLYVVVGHDENIRLLKGEGHPLFPATERRYVLGSIKYVTLALISTGDGWMDAEPEFEKIKPDIYAVNEDGDRPEKRAFCEEHGIEYRVLKRLPKEGLPRRQSTVLRGF